MRGAAVTLAPHTLEPPHPSHDLRGLHLHDRNGNRTQFVHPDGALFNIWYDGLNRPYYLFHSGWSGIAYVSYHPIGAPGAMGHAATTSYGYDGVQRPASLAHAFSGGAGSVVWTFGRNPAGQLGTVARDNDAFAWTGHYGVQRPYTTNGRNQYSAAGPTTLAYDDNGNLISETTANVTRTYSYDIENRLIGASVPGGSQVQLGYDPLGRLSWTTGSPDFTRFLYDGDALVAEYDYAGTIMTKRYAHWVGADVPMVSYEGASLANATGRWLFADHQGSIIAAAHPSGATDWVNTYDEYGIPGAGNQGRFQYTGQIWLAELGMYHYKARVYSPTLGRFLQTDPVGYQDQFNLYAYVGNDPVNQTDPTGEQSCLHPPCPDIPPPPNRETREARELVGHAQRRGGNERGVNSYRNTRTGQTRLESGRAAGRPITAANGRREFQHRLTWHRSTERPSLITHVHNGSERESRDLRRSSETRANNAPSDIDQIAMHQQGIPVQVVGPDVSTTLYRTDSQDRIRVESGDRSLIPDLSRQHIIIDPDR